MKPNKMEQTFMMNIEISWKPQEVSLTWQAQKVI